MQTCKENFTFQSHHIQLKKKNFDASVNNYYISEKW